MDEPVDPSPKLAAFADHPRLFQENRFVYPVLSRRSQGVSVGINLNPDKVCNFDCVYCQVDRRSAAVTRFVEMDQLLRELDGTIDLVASGEIYEVPPFSGAPERLRRMNDLAFSGDGEPTTYKNIDEIVERVAELKRSKGLSTVKMVMITNASMFHRPSVKRALATLDANQGEIWAKLDAGTEPYYRQIDRSPVPFHKVLSNLRDAAMVRPLVIQSLFMEVDGVGPSDEEIGAFCERLREVLESGGKIDRVQVYTVARRPAEESVGPLGAQRVEAIAKMVRERTGLPAEFFV